MLVWVVGVDGVSDVCGDEEGLPDGDAEHLVAGVEAAEHAADGLAHDGAAGALRGLGADLLVVEADDDADPGVRLEAVSAVLEQRHEAGVAVGLVIQPRTREHLPGRAPHRALLGVRQRELQVPDVGCKEIFNSLFSTNRIKSDDHRPGSQPSSCASKFIRTGECLSSVESSVLRLASTRPRMGVWWVSLLGPNAFLSSADWRWMQRVGTLSSGFWMWISLLSKPPFSFSTITHPARVKSLSNQVCHSPPP